MKKIITTFGISIALLSQSLLGIENKLDPRPMYPFGTPYNQWNQPLPMAPHGRTGNHHNNSEEHAHWLVSSLVPVLADHFSNKKKNKSQPTEQEKQTETHIALARNVLIGCAWTTACLPALGSFLGLPISFIASSMTDSFFETDTNTSHSYKTARYSGLAIGIAGAWLYYLNKE